MKVLLMLMDGMRPDSLPKVPEAQAMIARAAPLWMPRLSIPP